MQQFISIFNPGFRRLSLAILLFLAAIPLQAEYNYYSSPQPRGAIFSKFLDELEPAGIKLTTRKFFNEKTDGRLGFTFWLYPGKTHGEITFHKRSDGKGSVVRLFTQNSADALRLRTFFLKNLKMKEERGLSGEKPPNASEGF